MSVSKRAQRAAGPSLFDMADEDAAGAAAQAPVVADAGQHDHGQPAAGCAVADVVAADQPGHAGPARPQAAGRPVVALGAVGGAGHGPHAPPAAGGSRAHLERVRHLYPSVTEKELEAAGVDVPVRSRWELQGRGTVEVRGESPLVVWFSEPGASGLAQATLYRTEFLRKARRLP